MEHAEVYMNRGRWVVECPHEDCAWAYSAMSGAEPPAPLRFMRCRGGQGLQLDSGLVVGAPGCGRQFSLAWPPLEQALEIERLLFRRTSLATRNWRPPETVDTLYAENESLLVGWDVKRLAEAGIGVP
jgi:hypothetical protein